ncbi:hypothetical protein [Micromonospora aurantiaca (nom. illeg.)]|uniref:hypothetical protein n=1 Tax=Micromonospora aurantiaca (nom. illeg.) TaxID=47850 RepID=UPI001656FFDD|nr:hypothetical protein [Micromonospora aurantiaca]MBC9001385.1 hypothetical protein [Micromonospora aurantiaca]
MADPTREAVLRALADLWANGCPVPAPELHERLADVGLRRWRSVARRHRGRRLGPDDRLRDLVRGLVAAFEPDPKLVGPLVRDYECVARAIADAVTSTEPPGAVADAR